MSDFDAASPSLPWSEAHELISYYEGAQLIGCSAALGRKYQVAASIQATVWSVYPELLSSHHKLIMESVLATGFPRSVALPDATGRKLFIFRAEAALLGIFEIEETAASPSFSTKPETDDRILLRHQALHDALTGLPNRRQFSGDLDGNLPVQGGERLSLMQIDLDDFKPVNDTLGHAAGDRVLQKTAERLQALLSDGEIAYRLAGDEFAVIQRGGRLGQAERLAEVIVTALKEPITVDGIDVFVGASVGIGIAPEDGNDGEQLMRAADIALYAAKNDGRGRSRFFNRSMLITLEQREMLRRSLRVALQERQFFIEYQPLADAGVIVGFEALLRWQHPYAGIVPPNVFIPMAEADGLMGEIGEWVLEQACRQASAWPAHVTVAVNVSPAEFLRKGLTDRVASILDSADLPPERLELEITESVLLERTTNNLDTLHTLEVLGVRISLDDFGTRYSSLAYLKNFAFDTIKIDRYFIKDVATDEKSQTIVRSIIALAHGLRMRVTAEGVETEAQAHWLQKRGCHRLQGDLVSAPMSPDAIESFLRQASLATQ
ncbi:putative bifunctional diguanylate cyclase/phosphodiesterase [Sinorhizobium meliloti]|uniref:putative bifunctional diguanylate cyclase/phosphodiesterase n=1 Tax=Rhizobium meliloti TaxID=382 RepID=UPI000B49C474|nr:EAL domain-containing protein [Sinorhizobium meliloti]ASQ15053.1 GGDEF-domain containing protein [Sinorhizobium meliloti]MQU81983.1 EAL domain-containing protein [Sinorhizobium meliloti]MQU88385.1 EAL domain-containing protein [Sinorhizobium meliloti]